MSYGGYQQYGGNPYDNPAGGQQYTSGAAPTQYGNPYSQTNTATHGQAGYGASDSYATTAQNGAAPAAQPYGQQPYGLQPTVAPGQQAPPRVLSNQDFLARVENTRSDIRQLTSNVSEIGTIHQRILGSPDNTASAQLEHLVSQTQVLNTRIKDQIKALEADTAKSGKNTTKESQIRTLKQNFKSQLEDYQKEEQTYRQRYKEQIARQYRIVNPEASESEVREATEADWEDEGIFQTALRSNRSGAANSVLGSVRARHNDIQKIERTLIELNQLFQDLAAAVEVQEPAIQSAEQQTETVKKDTEAGNVQLTKGIKSARNRRKLKWWCLGIVVLILIIIAIILAVLFGAVKIQNGGSNSGNHS